MNQLAFEYRALDRHGATSRGVTRAMSQEEAYRKLAAANLTPVKLRLIKNKVRGRRKRITSRDISHFTYQLSVLTEARIPIADGLTSIADQEPNRALATVIEDIAQRIVAGNTITDALSAHHRLFGEIYIETIRAAEKSGNIIKILGHLAELLEKQTDTNQQVKSALMYPLMVVISLGLAVIFLMMFVVPRFAEMFAERGVPLPLPTRIMIGGSELICGYWWLFAVGGIGGIVGLKRAWRSPQGRATIDRYLHRVPYLRQILIGLGVSRFAHVFGLGLSSGLGLIECLEMSGRASGRPLLRRDTEKMVEQVNSGGRLSDVLMACSYFPGFAKRMITAGEESAELPKMCSIVARHYTRDVEYLAKNIGTVVEPVLIAGLAVVVLGLALAIFLPMWNMMALIE
ncbi:MAG: type II secretion system F family protein [Phycisphaerales bacterium]|nr:type II secretion system F family protein [Phycisphaerales bacterium]